MAGATKELLLLTRRFEALLQVPANGKPSHDLPFIFRFPAANTDDHNSCFELYRGFLQ